MKEPLFEQMLNKDKPVCPWCGTYAYDYKESYESPFELHCDHCNEDYEVYPTITYSTYPIESREN